MAAALLALPAHAQSLKELYEAARGFDATFLAAQAQFEADRARAEQARAGVLPSVELNGGANWTNTDSNIPSQDRTTNSQNIGVSASHPLYRPGNRIALEQALKSVEIAQARLESAEQDLIVRTAQAYFDVLGAEDNLTFVKAQKAAVSEQLAAAQRNFEVGTTTITDTREAEARFDLVRAQEIAAENDLRVKKLALDQLVGRSNTQPWRLAEGRALPAVVPDDADAWVSRAENVHPQLRQARRALDIAQLEVRRAETAKGPTLDAVAQYQFARGPNPTGTYARDYNATVGVRFNLPLYTGGAVQNRIAEALALQDRARADLDAAERTIAQTTRAAYFGVVSGMGQVKALEAAELSSQSALEANQLGYQVGVRINIDVLNAQSQLFQTKADLANARYSVLVNGLRLKQASGVLSAEDLDPINTLLQP
ncbi:TolC family outer membrane protein [Tepidicella baoligensis]|uniref:TolC family outer membrane protein n=1 Tax=Tepidicella baoligensis TaxID=2707016 RepID=UPI0015D9AA6F|nr:TolC family outer membrane protein [Tepidicella baoligensis]